MKKLMLLAPNARSMRTLALIAVAAAVVAACGGGHDASPFSSNTGSLPATATANTGSGSNSGAATGANGSAATPVASIVGKVLGAAMRYPTGFAKSSANGVDSNFSTTGDAVNPVAMPVAYQGVKVCLDANNNGLCETGEDFAMSAVDGSFSITSNATGTLLAVVDGNSSYLDPNLLPPSNRVNVPAKMLLRSPAQQLAAGGSVIISPLTTEVLRGIEADHLTFTAAAQAVADRLSLHNTPAIASDVSVTPLQVLGAAGDVSDDKARTSLLAESVALSSRFALASRIFDRGYITNAAVDVVSNVGAAQAAAFRLEDIPRYDHLFVVVFENHPNQVIDTPDNVNFYSYLNQQGNKAANYLSTGSPSEPNYIALGSADDWGVTDDSGWNCVPTGDTADLPTDVYNPRGSCTNATNHNIKGRRNMFSALYASGLATRVYSESIDPGQDPRNDGNGNSAIMGTNARTMQLEPMVSGLYKTKHQPAVAYDEIRNRPDFFRNHTRTVGGGQWDAGIASYTASHNISWNTHQLEDDLASGDVGALNYIVPDQCDDIHGLTSAAVPVPANCDAGPGGIQRGDAYAKYIVETIKASAIWKNSARKVGIVLVFDEGFPTSGSTSCCGWNSGGGATSGGPLDEGISSPIANYQSGNKGDYSSIFGVLNNQSGAPKMLVDSDSYSHFSFVRTLQDIYGLSDPGVPTSYMNRSKYTQSYIANNLVKLTEYSGSANTHFDAVRAMNHSYAVKTGDKTSNATPIVVPDANQTNIWALK